MTQVQQEGRPINVLLVEDEAIISEWVKDTLTEDGFAVHAVANAREALAYLDARRDVDVLFTDINLPGDMDGSRLAWAAWKLKPDLTVVYASGRVRAVDPTLRVPGSAFVPKPYMPSQISSLLQRMVNPRVAPTAH
jgi:DNA-binding NtrC family response regulator